VGDVEDAAEAARAEVIREAAPGLVAAQAKAYAGDRLGDRLDVLLANVDASRFVDDHGVVDTARLRALVDSVGGPAPAAPPVDMGQGQRVPAGGFRPSVELGAALWHEQHAAPPSPFDMPSRPGVGATSGAGNGSTPAKPAAAGSMAAGAELYRKLNGGAR
jgi:hypothetical protein